MSEATMACGREAKLTVPEDPHKLLCRKVGSGSLNGLISAEELPTFSSTTKPKLRQCSPRCKAISSLQLIGPAIKDCLTQPFAAIDFHPTSARIGRTQTQPRPVMRLSIAPPKLGKCALQARVLLAVYGTAIAPQAARFIQTGAPCIRTKPAIAATNPSRQRVVANCDRSGGSAAVVG